MSGSRTLRLAQAAPCGPICWATPLLYCSNPPSASGSFWQAGRQAGRVLPWMCETWKCMCLEEPKSSVISLRQTSLRATPPHPKHLRQKKEEFKWEPVVSYQPKPNTDYRCVKSMVIASPWNPLPLTGPKADSANVYVCFTDGGDAFPQFAYLFETHNPRSGLVFACDAVSHSANYVNSTWQPTKHREGDITKKQGDWKKRGGPAHGPVH